MSNEPVGDGIADDTEAVRAGDVPQAVRDLDIPAPVRTWDDDQRELAELRVRLAAAQEQIAGWQDAARIEEKRADAAQERERVLREALERYGDHDSVCDAVKPIPNNVAAELAKGSSEAANAWLSSEQFACTCGYAAALDATRAALVDELAAALQEAIGWLEHGIPESCGQCGSPNATCDMQCVEAVQYSQDTRHIHTALAAYDAAIAAQDGTIKQES